MKYTHIVFDVDGTMLDTEEAVLLSFQTALGEIGLVKDIQELTFCLGITGQAALERLSIPNKEEVLGRWLSHMAELEDRIHVFNGIPELLQALKEKGISLGVVTSRIREEYREDMDKNGLSAYFDTVICAEDTKNHKPDPDPMLQYLEITGADPKRVLYIGDSIYDMQCAGSAGVSRGLALWGCNSVRHIRADHYFPEPYDVLALMNRKEKESKTAWLDWAMELQFIAQAGITYSKDGYDVERFERIRDLSAEIVAAYTDIDMDKVRSLFCNEIGYQTPKLDTRAAIIEDGKILLVKEKDGFWSMPGGWVDVNQTIGTNVVKEVKEESGLDVIPVRIVALQDMAIHNLPMFPFGVCKVFLLCRVIAGAFEANIETVESRYFGLEELPELSEKKNTREQIAMCFAAYENENWKPLFD